MGIAIRTISGSPSISIAAVSTYTRQPRPTRKSDERRFYKLIVAGSIEEKNLGLQDKKAALAKFSADDISALLAPLS